MSEPQIQIGGYVLTEAQAMAVRVAITDFHAQICDDEEFIALGPIADTYRDRLHEVIKIIFEVMK